MRIVRSARRVRMLDRGDVVSDLLLAPGPTHDLFDVLAACLVAAARGPRIALVGFAAGGVVAPLRAMGFDGPIDAVDASPRGHAIFREVASAWGGTVRFTASDAQVWLAQRPGRFDAILEDLSVPAPGGHVKPGMSFLDLPRVLDASLRPGGAAVINVLPPDDRDFRAALDASAAPWPRALVVTGEAWDNRIVVAGRRIARGPAFGRRVRALLADLGSREVSRLRVRRLR